MVRYIALAFSVVALAACSAESPAPGPSTRADDIATATAASLSDIAIEHGDTANDYVFSWTVEPSDAGVSISVSADRTTSQ